MNLWWKVAQISEVLENRDNITVSQKAIPLTQWEKRQLGS